MSQTITASVMADSNGIGAFQFPTPRVGTQMTGTVAVPGAPLSALFLPKINGQGLGGRFYGPGTWGPITVPAGQYMSFVCTGLTPKTSYTAYWYANVERASGQTVQAPPSTPASGLAQSVIPVNSGGNVFQEVISPIAGFTFELQYITLASVLVSTNGSLTIALANYAGGQVITPYIWSITMAALTANTVSNPGSISLYSLGSQPGAGVAFGSPTNISANISGTLGYNTIPLL